MSFANAAEPRLWAPMAMGERRAVVVTVARYDVSAPLSPIARERYPDLVRLVPVADRADAARFEAIGMRAVLDRSTPRGLDLAAALLEQLGVPRDRVDRWMQRHQERALDGGGAAYPLTGRAA